MTGGQEPPATRVERVTVDGVPLAYRRAGSGDAVLLLHGCPQTSHAWRHVLPRLAMSHDVIAPDLPGLGDSAPSRRGYTKQALATYLGGLLDALGVDRVHVVGHDMGATVAYALAADRREQVRSLAVIDVLLAGAGFEQFGLDFTAPGRGLWHFVFHAVPDVPESLVTGREAAYLGQFWYGAAYDTTAIGPADAAEYLRCYTAPGALSRYFAYYRTWLQDAADNEADNQGGSRVALTCPTLAVGADHSIGANVEDSVRQVADDVVGQVIERCGHWVPEERPDALVDVLNGHFGRTAER